MQARVCVRSNGTSFTYHYQPKIHNIDMHVGHFTLNYSSMLSPDDTYTANITLTYKSGR